MHGSGRTASGRWGYRAVAALVLLVGVGLLLGSPAGAQSPPDGEPYALLVELDHPIDNVTARFLSRTLDSEEAEAAEVVIIQLDTPGGLVDAMRDMVSDIFSASRPVVVYVAPEGARAASAGTFITAAGGVAAMAPATNIGAAAVVGGQGEDLPETLGEKATQDARAFMRSIAERRERNVEALEATVLEATAYSAVEAEREGITDLVADDVPDLLEQIDGMPVPTGEEDVNVTVDTDGLPVRSVGLNLVEQFMSFVANPNIAFLLVSLGSLAIFVELLNFGMIIPGVLGVVMLVLGFTGVGQLPFSWGGVALIILAMVFFVAEAQAPGLGVFGGLGAVTLILGGLFLVGFFGSPEVPGSPSVRVSRWLLVGVGIAAGLGVVWLAREFQKARGGPGYVSPVAREAMIGQVATVTRRLDPKGEVHFADEFWEATLPPGQRAEEGTSVWVVDVQGYQVTVVPVEEGAEASVAGTTWPASPAAPTAPPPSDTPQEGGEDGDHQLRQGL